MKQTQQQRILAVLKAIRTGEHEVPEDYIRRYSTGDGVSARYFKQVLLVSECNGRISELRSKGYVIETSAVKDRYGFAYHRLAPSEKRGRPASQANPLPGSAADATGAESCALPI